MSVFDTLVGQRHAVEALRRAVDGHGMTHAWLITGPPGSGRSNAAVAFAAALQCERGGCGECQSCRTVLAGSHPDVIRVATETTVHRIDDMRELVVKAAMSPSVGRYQIVVVEDADRLTIGENTRTANALLLAIEEPTPRTVWLLCAPTVEDVLPTIRSRCRSVVLTTPTDAEVMSFLVERVGVSPEVASYAARASQGHIGRARALATDERTRARRDEVVRLPRAMTGLGDCLGAAATLVDIAKQETAALTEASNGRELAELDAMLGSDPRSKSSRTYKAALRDLTDVQKQRERRRNLDVVDRCLTDLVSVYRDVVAVQLGADERLVNAELSADVRELARHTTPESNLRRIDAIFTAREQMLDFNVTPLLALESMTMALML